MCMCVCVCVRERAQVLSRVLFFAAPWTVACQAPPSIEFSRQEYWSGLPCLLPGDLPNAGIKLMSLMSPALVSRFFITCATSEAPIECLLHAKSYLIYYPFYLPFYLLPRELSSLCNYVHPAFYRSHCPHFWNISKPSIMILSLP